MWWTFNDLRVDKIIKILVPLSDLVVLNRESFKKTQERLSELSSEIDNLSELVFESKRKIIGLQDKDSKYSTKKKGRKHA